MSDAVVAGLAIAGFAMGLAALGAALAALAAARRSSRRAGRRGDVGAGSAASTIGDVQSLGAHVDEVVSEVERLRVALARTLSRVATVRYDAFSDVGGRLSSSSALLDEAGSGVVITSLHGRSESRTYTKSVADGRSPQRLSAEEAEAVRAALDGHGGNGAAPPRLSRSARTGRWS